MLAGLAMEPRRRPGALPKRTQSMRVKVYLVRT